LPGDDDLIAAGVRLPVGAVTPPGLGLADEIRDEGLYTLRVRVESALPTTQRVALRPAYRWSSADASAGWVGASAAAAQQITSSASRRACGAFLIGMPLTQGVEPLDGRAIIVVRRRR
jgi:hypothetical protein